MNTSSLPTLLQGFFTERLRTQLGASSYTVATYRDTFRLLLRFAGERLKQAPFKVRVVTHAHRRDTLDCSMIYG